MELIELLEMANKGYPDNELAQRYLPIKDGNLKHLDGQVAGDPLADFIVIELIETFDQYKSSNEQIYTAIMALEEAMEDIEDTIHAIQQATV